MLTGKQNKVITAIVAGKNKSEAGAAAGVSLRTVYTYFKSSEFMEELRRQQAALVEAAAGRGRARMGDAMMVFESVMNDHEQNGQVRIQAARNLLQFALELDERANILARIEQLEKSLQGGEYE